MAGETVHVHPGGSPGVSPSGGSSGWSTEGVVPFANSSGELTQSTNFRFVAASSRLIVPVPNSSVVAGLGFPNSNAGIAKSPFSTSGMTVVGGNGIIAEFDGSGNQFRPRGAIETTGPMTLQSTKGSIVSGGITFQVSASSGTFTWNDTAGLNWAVLSTDQLRLTTAHEVHVGTSGDIAPAVHQTSGRMNIYGMGAGSSAPTYYVTGFAAAPRWIARRSEGVSTAPTSVAVNQTIGSWSGQGWNGDTWTGDRARISMTAAEAWTSLANGTDITFHTVSTGTVTLVERVRVDSEGRVGVGTTDPTALLTVGTSNSSGRLALPSTLNVSTAVGASGAGVEISTVVKPEVYIKIIAPNAAGTLTTLYIPAFNSTG